MNKEEQNLDNTENPKLGISDVSSSTVIEPISCELSEDMKSHIEMIECVNDNFNKYITKALMIPKEIDYIKTDKWFAWRPVKTTNAGWIK
jgi:hypothetical protein